MAYSWIKLFEYENRTLMIGRRFSVNRGLEISFLVKVNDNATQFASLEGALNKFNEPYSEGLIAIAKTNTRLPISDMMKNMPKW